jgi:hypothetical protein
MIFLADPLRFKLEMLERADSPHFSFFYPTDWSLGIERIRYESPLEIESSTQPEPHRSVSVSKVRAIARAVVGILSIDLIRDKAQWDTELAKQKAIEAALKNHERALNLSKKINDPMLREEFIRNMARSIVPLSRKGGPRLTEIEVLDPPSKD